MAQLMAAECDNRKSFGETNFKSEVSHCSKKLSFTTASATISDFAQKGELLFKNSDQIELDDYANFR